MEDTNNDDSCEQIRISLLPAPGVNDSTLKVPSDAIAVPATIRRRGLSAVVNHLLDRKVVSDDDVDSNDDSDSDDSDSEDKLPSISFDFLIQNKLLRVSVESFVRREHLSLENEVEIHYFPAMEAPTVDGQSEVLPDWISAMQCCANTNTLVSGSYDGSLRLFNTNAATEELVCHEAHSGAIKCLSTMSLGSKDGNMLIASGSMDHTLKTHVYSPDTNAVKVQAVYTKGHFSSVEAVALSNNTADLSSKNTLMASGDWTGGLCLWNIGNGNNDNDDTTTHTTKKLKHSTSSKTPSSSRLLSLERSPTTSWKAHASAITGICFSSHNNNSSLLTSSYDYSLKLWDTQRQDCLLTLNGSKVIACMGLCAVHPDIVATGHPDCSVQLWDVRMNNNNTNTNNNSSGATTRLKPSHRKWVSDVQWSPSQPHVLATTSHDGTVKMWDIRSTLPLHTKKVYNSGKNEKGLCLAFDSGSGSGIGSEALFSGGTDCRIHKLTWK